jgi:protein TonB
MKRTIVAILALSPAILFAQSKTPAQPVSTPVLQSSNIQPAELAALKSADNAKTVTPVRVSTGVTAPTLIQEQTDAEQELSPATIHLQRVVVVELMVDASGKPADLKVVQSADKFTDEDAVAAISKYRFKPGMLDGQPTSVPLRLRYVIQKNLNN